MTNKSLKVGTVILLCALCLGAFSFSLITYSDSDDPLVTLSYLTDIILPQMKKDILMEVATQENASGVISPDAPSASASEVSGDYTLLELENGQCLYTNSVCEFIVRPGSDVQAVSPFETQGIADLTNGTEYLDGDTIALNAYCVIPRGSDGRGIVVLNEKSYILVRGEYYIG